MFATLITVGSFYQVSGHTKMVVMSIIPLALLQWPMFCIVTTVFGDEQLWMTFALTGLAAIGCMAIISEVVRRKMGKTAHVFTLIPKTSPDEIMQTSVSATQQGVAQVISLLEERLQELQITQQQRNAIEHSLEELMLNIVAHGGHMDGHYFDLRLMQSPDKIYASIKDDGRPFDPTNFSTEQRQAGLQIAFSFASEINYKYMYGQNVVNLTWNATSTK